MIVAKNVSRSHKSFKILHEINVSVEKGEMLIIIGPNGAGKSTLLSSLADESRLQHDEIYFKGKKMSDWSKADLARHKAKFSQENNSDIGLLVKDIVLMGRYPYFNTQPHKQDWEVVHQAMERTDILKLKDRDYNSLSGGEKQRVHLARVLAQLENDDVDSLALFDEPLNNLDVRHQYHILETIRQYTEKGNSAILVLHDLNLAAEFADKVLLLKRGEVVAHGRPEYIFREDIISKAYDFPCAICKNPVTQNPMIVFRNQNRRCSMGKLNQSFG